MRQSVEHSLHLRCRDRIEMLLLHEAGLPGITVEGWSMLRQAKGAEQAEAIGFAHFGPPRCQSSDLTIQAAPRARDFLESATGLRVYHFIRGAAILACRSDEQVASAITDLKTRYQLAEEGEAGDLIAAIDLPRPNAPDALLILATTCHDWLRNITRLAARIDGPAACVQGANSSGNLT